MRQWFSHVRHDLIRAGQKRRLCVVAIIVLFAACFLPSLRLLISIPEDCQETLLTPDALAVMNYQVNESSYVSLSNDGQLLLPELETPVYHVRVLFAQGLQQSQLVTVYYGNDNNFSEDRHKTIQVEQGADSCSFALRNGYRNLRVDIGNEPAQCFELEGILLNGQEELRELRSIVLTQNLLLLLCATLVLAALLIMTLLREAHRYVAVLFLLGLAYLLIIPPFAAPDEPFYYWHALTNASSLLHAGQPIADLSCFNFENAINALGRNQTGLYALRHFFNQPSGVSAPINGYEWIADPSYFVHTVAAFLGQLTQRNGIQLLYLMRLANLSFYAVVAGNAIRIAPKHKRLLLVCSMLPMSLHQAAAVTCDGYIIAMNLLLLAMLLRFIDSEAESQEMLLPIAVMSVLTVPAKLIYGVVLLLLFQAPAVRFGGKREKRRWIAAIFLTVCLVSVLINMTKITNSIYGTTGDLVTGLNPSGEINYSLSFIFLHPGQTLQIIIQTLLESGLWYGKTCIGAYLCRLDVVIDNRLIWGFFLLFLCNALCGEQHIARRRRILCLLGFLATGISILLIMMNTYTGNTRTVIQGVQGRYFLPMLPLLGIAMTRNTKRCRDENASELLMRVFACALTLLQYGTMISFLNNL